jgi:serine protease
MNTWHTAVSLMLALLLVACGGGGGGSSSSSPSQPDPTPPPLPPVEEPEVGFSISGSINVPTNLVVDGDTNNPEEATLANNSVATAQPISNPVTLGGYVNQPGAGEPGATQIAGDIDDFFRVELLAGQVVTLLVAEFEQADADLYLYDLNGEILDFSIETGEVESLLIAEDGIYLVNVFGIDGATNYVLAIGSTNTVAAARTSLTKAKSRVIPWEAIVVHAEDGAGALQSREETRRRLGVKRRSDVGSGRGKRRQRLMAIQDKALSGHQRANRLGRAKGRELRLRSPELLARWETLMTIKALRREPGIVSAEPNYRVHALATPDDEAYPFQWHYPLINLPAAWDLTTGEPEVVVAVIDTGILGNHPDIIGQLVPGYDFISNAQRAGDGNGIDPDPEDVGDGNELGSSSFHGTHVSGTVAAASDNGIGVAGVAWNTRIMPLRVLGVDGGSTYDVGQAIRYAAGLANDSGTVPDRRADVINLSLGGGAFSQSSQNLIDSVREAGVIVVAAAGNEASRTPSYPASYNGVISVSAVDSQRQAASYSNFGDTIDIAAPGGNNGVDLNGDGYPDGVLSTGGSVSESGTINFVYSFLNGTSMASPHVAGVMALMKSVNPGLSPADIDTLLIQGELTDEVGAPGRDNRFGHGLVNAYSAVAAALNAAGNPPADNPRLGASTSLLNFGSAAKSLNLVLQNSGEGELEILEVTSPESWLTIIAADIDDSALGVYRLDVVRENLQPGVYRALVSAISNINTLEIEVLVSVASEATGGDVGLIYLLLVDTETQEVVAQFDASAISGVYSYEFRDIPAGTYELFAGTDADNDLFICDAGEACGAYLTVDQPIRLEVDADSEKLEFPVEYRVNIPTINSLSEQSSARTRGGILRRQ